MRHIVVAHSKDRVIGNDKALPWAGDLPADMRHFRELTLGHAVIMGRTTYDSIGRPLPQRHNIVLSRQADLSIDGCTVVHSLDEAYEVAQGNEEVFVIGGEKVYRLALPTVDRLHVTEIDTSLSGDSHFIEVNPEEWSETNREEYFADEKNRFNYRFITYDRVR